MLHPSFCRWRWALMMSESHTDREEDYRFLHSMLMEKKVHLLFKVKTINILKILFYSQIQLQLLQGSKQNPRFVKLQIDAGVADCRWMKVILLAVFKEDAEVSVVSRCVFLMVYCRDVQLYFNLGHVITMVTNQRRGCSLFSYVVRFPLS